MRAILALGLCLLAGPVFGGEHDLPDPRLTPGAVIPGVTTADICVPGYAKSARHVTAEAKAAVYATYGLDGNHTGYCGGEQGCEIDHLISLELGGSNEPANLWPEPFDGTPWNAHTKDRLENRLHRLVCAGAIRLEEAQQVIAKDWTAAYRRYIGEPEMTPVSDER